MKIINGWLLGLFLFVSFNSPGQTPPPNDNYANRTVLSGTDVTFSGTLAGATLEGGQDLAALVGFFPSLQAPPTQSVWWTWTAPATGILNLEVLNSPLAIFHYAFLSVYSATNGITSLDGLVQPPLITKFLYKSIVPEALSIPVTAGSNYQIQLVGLFSENFSFRLIETNLPIITRQPQSQTVSSNACIFFYVAYCGMEHASFKFQWLKDGNPLAGETAPVFTVTNIDSTLAGAYSVIVSNSVGYAISEPAILTVSQSNAPISLAAMGVQSNSFMFSVTGENGRKYRLQSSTNLINWVSEYYDPIHNNDSGPLAYAVFLNTNSPFIINQPNAFSHKFFRVTPYVTPDHESEICINNLGQIRIAKLLWAQDYDVPFGYPRPADLFPYFPHGAGPVCPLDGYGITATSYNFGDILYDPQCLYRFYHTLEDVP